MYDLKNNLLLILCLLCSSAFAQTKFTIQADPGLKNVKIDGREFPLKDGKLEIIIETPKPQYLDFYGSHLKMNRLYLEPNKSLSMAVTGSEFTFGSDLAQENHLISKNNYQVLRESDFKLPAGEFLKKVNETIQYNRSLVEKIENKTFVSCESERVKCMINSCLGRYDNFNKIFSGESNSADDKQLKEYILSVIKADDKYRENHGYRMMVLGLAKKINEHTIMNTDRNWVNQSELAAAYMKSIEDYILPKAPLMAEACAAEVGLNYIRVRKANPAIEKSFYAIVKDKALREEFRGHYERWSKVMPGCTMPDIEGVDMDGKKVKLSDFRGKVLFIDFWASWCGPCKGEIERGSPILHEKFKGNKDIVFIFASVDTNIDKWKETVLKLKPEGVNIIIDPKMFPANEAIFKLMTISSYPRYMIVDRDGKIVDEEAPRSSNPEAEKLIKKVL